MNRVNKTKTPEFGGIKINKMKQLKNILVKMQEIKKEQEHYKERMSNYQWTELEKIEGSSRYGDLQEKEGCCTKRIELLEWVIK